ncbi:uncharacterized protein N7484_005813 [Penicillium longicatenatum]|uniref:uncharacterized protein n=1 Tax=Penicillium longicatenatum TaxID=1561947 RepID=UPI002548D217|nr:uncharacterized protein N7484_005813 [Penicillium longicatenatum]KAJ5643306.1 hypothetical protein N7484_005813 [Penicillium longicatenatum]
MASTSLTASYLTPDPSFNWFFLLWLIVCCILVLFFLLYFNRLFATLLSYGIKAYTWHYYRVFVDINALQISLLGGRIFFKGIRYHGVNETIFIHGGFITWRYWKRPVARTDLSDANEDLKENTGGYSAPGNERKGSIPGTSSDKNASLGEQGGAEKTIDLPCRISIKVYGLEWFVYNRTPAYDSILAGFGYTKDRWDDDENNGHPQPDEQPARTNTTFTMESGPGNKASADNVSKRSIDGSESLNYQNSNIRNAELSDPVSNMLGLLPLKLDCTKGAIVMGNENTRSVLTTTFDGATGNIAACKAGPLDLYRQLFTFQFKHPVIQMRPNPDFKQTQLATAKVLSTAEEEEPVPKPKLGNLFSYRSQRRKIWHGIRELVPYFQTSVESFTLGDKKADIMPRSQAEFPNAIRWTGLSRYLDEDDDDDHEKWNSVEYARFSTIFDGPSLDFTYFWDIPGRVRPEQLVPSQDLGKNINHAPPPEWGIDLKIDGGAINYGPWADRERIGLQNVFFPNFYRSAEPAEPLTTGVLRQSTSFKLRVEICEELILRIPTREQSKDWQWKGRADAIGGTSKGKKQSDRSKSRPKEGEKGHVGPDIRPFGWLSLRVGPDSTITYTMDMAASITGYRNELALELRESKLSSSVNHGLLWQCPRQLVTCDLSNPLCWNSLRTWKFAVDSHGMELFLLRDHIFLLTDLVTDWASGPPSEYYTFVPFIYNIDLSFSNLQLLINVNDRNIISNPSDREDNRFIVIKGKQLTANVIIPLNKYQPEQNAVEFRVNLQDGGVDHLVPAWDTHHAFLPGTSMATLDSLLIDGSYTYFLSTSPDLTDTLVLNLDGASPRCYLYGFLVKSFMAVKENYFGDEMHFRTLEEYQELAFANEPPANPTGINPNRRSNDMDVLIHVVVDSPCALLPENIYDQLECTRLRAASLEADLRFTNYYMDMQLSISPLKIDQQSTQEDGSTAVSDTQLFIDGISAYGHRLFGLPPAEPTYVCNWDFDVGKIIGECSPEFLACLASSIKSFDFSFDNEENTLHPIFPPVLHDVTFLRAKISSTHVSVLLDHTALILSSKPLTINFNDWANTKFSKRMNLLMPDLTIAAVDRQSANLAFKSSDKRVDPLGIIQVTIRFKMALRKQDIAESRRLQQEHIQVHDKRTHRSQWLLFDWEDIAPISSIPHDDGLSPPTIAIPSMPEPMHQRLSSVNAPSYRGFSGTQPAGSARSFLVHSETSSLKSTKIRGNGIQGTISVSSSEPLRRPVAPVRDASRSTTQANRFKDNESYGYSTPRATSYSPAAIRDANPWILPKFSYYKLFLDTSELPSINSSNPGDNEDDKYPTPHSMFLTFEDDQTTYTNLALDLPLGIRGFCTPRFLFTLSALLDGFEPKHPVQIIDSLQKDVISDIVGYDKSMSQPKKTTAVSLRIPSIHLRLVDVSESPNNKHVEFRDEYSIEVHHLRTEFQRRIQRQKGDLLEGLKQGITVHAAADHISISVEGSRADAFQEKAAFNCNLSDMNFWLVTSPNIRSNLQMRTFNTITSARSVERLAFLVRGATTMFDSVASAFQQVSIASTRRLQYLIYFATLSATDIGDPIFLARISNVLRVASTHLRQHDSWKIISRIRNIYRNLPAHHRRELDRKCLSNNLPLPRNARSTVFTGFDQWRAWDLAHVEKSYVMRRIWSNPESEKAATKPSMFMSCTVKTFRFSLDPGPRGTDFIVEDLSTVISLVAENISSDGDKLRLKNLVTLQAYCSSAALHLRWEVLDLVEGIMKVMSTVTLESKPVQSPSNDGEKEPTELQIVFGTDFGSITLDGINVKLALVSKALRSSIVHSSHGAKPAHKEDLALLFSADACSSELLSQSGSLMLSSIADPYFYFSLVSEEDETQSRNDWKVAASCRKLRFDMKEDPVGLAHVADRIIEDEVRYIRQLTGNCKLPKPATPEVEMPPASKKPTHHRINVAMFLDDYQLRFSLLPSLTYLITGDVARMSVMPTKSSQIEVDFDVKQNSHLFLSGEGAKSRTLSKLEIPPTNGRILANISSGRKELEVDLTIELIRLEASAVRSLLGVLTGPDVAHLLEDLKQNLDVLQSHLSNALSLEKANAEPAPLSEESVILYKARLTMAGFEIHAVAPGLNGKDYKAEMVFSLGTMQMSLQNGLDRGYAMEYPEFNIDASQISFLLRRLERTKTKSYGGFTFAVKLLGTSAVRENGEVMRAYHFTSDKFDIELFAETAALVVDIAIYTQERIKTLDLSHEVKRLRRLRHRHHKEIIGAQSDVPKIQVNDDAAAQAFLNALYSFHFRGIQVAWNMTPLSDGAGRQPEDLVFSIQQVELSNKKKNAARLRIENMQLQMVPFRADRKKRSLNSALMPQLVFNVGYHSIGKELWLAFQAAGKSLDIRATSEFIIPGNMIRNSIASATEALREGKAAWATKPTPNPENGPKSQSLFGNRRLRSVFVDVDFAGATVSLQGKRSQDPQTLMAANIKSSRLSEARYGEYVQGDSATTATLQAPGVALKVHFEDNGTDDPALNAELKVNPSTNVLYPTLVPLVKQMTATVKEIMREKDQQHRLRRPSAAAKLQPQKIMQEAPFGAPDPSSILGRCKVNLGLLFCKQEFSLSCQPIARVAATARFESVYVTVNTILSNEQGRFVALSLAFNDLEASVKHVYSNESTASFEVRSMVLSLMNSKHLGRTSGVSAILKVSPMKVILNAKQVQDSLLFQEIWLPSDDEPSSNSTPRPEESHEPEAQTYIVQRYQQVAAASAFPWNTTIAIEKLEIQLDLGSTLGKAQFAIDNLWVSSNKTSDNEQSMCINFDSIGIESKGRMSGIVELRTLKVSTSIQWPESREAGHTPLIQASIAFHHLQAKVSFDYQPFLVAHIAMFDFLMYNVREPSGEQSQRLFSILEGDEVQVFCTSLTASQALALFQAWQRLVQDKQSAYEASLREVERYLRRKSSAVPSQLETRAKEQNQKDEESERAPIQLHTGVVVSIRHINLGAFPSSFFDNQIFKLEAYDAQARFSVSLESDKIHSALGLTLGQLRVALSGISRPSSAQLEELSVDEIAQRAAGSRGGTILKVPRLVAGMETWQAPGDREIEYIFHSSFEGKVDVGWNYSRISFIRDMWESHLRALASRLGKPLAPSAVRITGGPGSSTEGGGEGAEQQEKITAVVNVPQSKYTYTALEPPVIETPQLRDMGEATPPLEWIGLQRDKLPNVTHQIIIVTLLEIAKEVEDAYGTILGT